MAFIVDARMLDRILLGKVTPFFRDTKTKTPESSSSSHEIQVESISVIFLAIDLTEMITRNKSPNPSGSSIKFRLFQEPGDSGGNYLANSICYFKDSDACKHAINNIY